jgi:hypothetical protein
VNLPKTTRKPEEEEEKNEFWTGVEVQEIDEGKTLFEVERPKKEEPKKPATPAKRGGKKAANGSAKTGLAALSPFDEI